MRILLIVALFVCSARCWATSYYMSATGSDGAAGTSTGTAWASPNHTLNCGDTITAAAGAYNTNSFAFGTVTCAANNNVAWLQCATPFACTGAVTSGGQYAQGIGIGKSYWGVQGWVISTYSGGGACFSIIPGTSSTSISHIIIANNISNGCGQGGIGFSTNGSAGVDYIAVLGNIVYNAVQGSNFCTSGINTFQPSQADSLPGTHIYFAGNFSTNNVEPVTCNGTGPTDGQGLFFDTTNPYSQQMVITNNMSLYNGGAALKSYSNTTGSPNAKMYFLNNTTYGNQTGNISGAICAELALQSNYNTEVYRNLSQTGSATGCSGSTPLYVLGAVSSNATDIYWDNYGYSAAGNNSSLSAVTAVSNTFSNPSFAAPANPGAPSCGSYATTTACMATAIANFTPTVAAAKLYGYQRPVSTSAYDPLFPQWLCSASVPSGLVTMGCLIGSSMR